MAKGNSKLNTNAGGGSTKVTNTAKSKEELKEELQGLREKRRDFINQYMDEEGYIDPDKIKEWEDLNAQIDSKEYDLHKQLSPTFSAEKWNPNGNTDLSKEEGEIARQDLLRNKEIYMAIKSAEHGIKYDEKTFNTAVDDLYAEKPKKVYDNFKDTRAMLKNKYGDTVTLYRAGTEQTAKATQNMTTNRKNAQQYADIYGSKVQSMKVPVKDILCVNISRSGNYEEVLVLNKKRK